MQEGEVAVGLLAAALYGMACRHLSACEGTLRLALRLLELMHI